MPTRTRRLVLPLLVLFLSAGSLAGKDEGQDKAPPEVVSE